MSTKRKPTTTLARPVVKQSAKIPTKTRIDETRTSVAIGQSQKPESAVEELNESNPNSDAEEEDQSEDESKEESAQPESTAPEVSKLKTGQDGDIEMEQVDGEDAEEAPSFGDLVRGNSTVDVSASLAADASTQARAGGKKGEVAPVNAISMGVTLEQALKTDDNDLLESVLQINNIETIQNTINRMDSALAGILLSKLAARMHRRPGRAYSLMNWVQWTLIAHGGALVGQPDLVKRLGELNRVLEERSRGLTSLLALKGKLDMLDAQMRFRKAIRSQNPKSKAHDEEESDEDEAENVDEPGVVFVEGDGNEIHVLEGRALADDEEDDFPAMNGVGGDSDEDSEDDEDFADEDEVEEESMDEDEVDHDDVEESGEEESDNDSGPPAKVQKVASKFAKRK